MAKVTNIISDVVSYEVFLKNAIFEIFLNKWYFLRNLFFLTTNISLKNIWESIPTIKSFYSKMTYFRNINVNKYFQIKATKLNIVQKSDYTNYWFSIKEHYFYSIFS